MNYSIVVYASASDPAPDAHTCSYAGCAIGEYFRDRGQACSYVFMTIVQARPLLSRISLLLRRPPGREAYPGDVSTSILDFWKGLQN